MRCVSSRTQTAVVKRLVFWVLDAQKMGRWRKSLGRNYIRVVQGSNAVDDPEEVGIVKRE
jgi:hypothetical protein